MILDVYGRRVRIDREGETWSAYYLGSEGKRRSAQDIRIPGHLGAEEIPRYVADLCHEWAAPGRSEVRRLD